MTPPDAYQAADLAALGEANARWELARVQRSTTVDRWLVQSVYFLSLGLAFLLLWILATSNPSGVCHLSFAFP